MGQAARVREARGRAWESGWDVVRLANLQSFHGPAALEVLPGKLLRTAGSSDDLFLAPPDEQHPVLRGFRTKQSEVPWAAFPVYKYWQLSEIDEGVNTIIPFNNDKPALLEQAIGRGAW